MWPGLPNNYKFILTKKTPGNHAISSVTIDIAAVVQTFNFFHIKCIVCGDCDEKSVALSVLKALIIVLPKLIIVRLGQVKIINEGLRVTSHFLRWETE